MIAFWDETHSICEISKIPVATANTYILEFKRDENGKICKDGKYRDKDAVILNYKYDQEIQLMLGVATVKYNDGNVIGKRAKPFSYTEKNVISDKDFQFHLRNEIQTIKNTIPDEHGKKEKWTENLSNKDSIYNYDDLNVIKEISKAKMTIINNNIIQKVNDLKEKFQIDDEKKQFTKDIKGIGKTSMDSWCNQAKNVITGSCLAMIDYTLADNPINKI